MRSNYFKATLKAAILAVTVLLLTAGLASAQSVVNLTAARQTYTAPDGNTIPMFGWTCGGVTGTTTAAATPATTTCTALTYNATTGAHNPQTNISTWQPPLIVVPYTGATTSLTINLTNTLPVATSLVIIGQSGGGLGVPVREAGPRTDGAHAGQTATTWTTVVTAPSPAPNTTVLFTPPSQGNRARTFTSVEVAGVATVGGAAAAPGVYTYTGLLPGTYLIRTGTYPSIQGPMGLYGVLVVTQAAAGATPGLAYPVPATSTTTGVTYDADVVALESEIDDRQNKMVAALFPVGGAAGSSTTNAGFSETMKWTPACGAATNSLLSATGAVPTCYPPAVDYTPKYFAINGLAFSKDNLAASALSVPSTATANTGNVLIRYVNAGSHMHTMTVNGLNMLLVAEDGFVLPDVALAISAPQSKTLTANNPPAAGQALGLRIQDEVFQAAGKVFDVIVSPAKTGTSFTAATYTTWDRSLALGTNSQRDGGMQAILDVNDGGAKLTAAQASYVAVANPDTYAFAPGVTLKVTDPGKGVVANDVNVYGVQVLATTTHGTLTLYPNGTFIYTPTGNVADSFTYCANGSVTAAVCSSGISTTVTLNVSATANAANAPHANNDSFTSPSASLMRVAAPGVLLNDTDPNKFPLTAVIGTPTGVTVNLAADGSFTAVPATAGTCGPPAGCTFTYQAKNSQAILSNVATATVIFQPGSGLRVLVQDAKTKVAITDYKWILEQDMTLHIDPACQVNSGSATGRVGSNGLACPNLPAGSTAPDTPATQFHASFYPVIATGCTGPQSCGQGQTVYDAGTPCTAPGVPVGCSATAGQHVKAACDGYGICTIGANMLPTSLPSDAQLTAVNPDGTPATYYLSILSGDAANAFNTANTKDPSVAGNCVPGTEPTGISVASTCGHTMGGSPVPAGICTGTVGTASYACTYPAPVAPATANVTVNLELAPLKTATVTAFIFEDDFPLNGEPDTGGGVDSLSTQEVPLGDFQFEIWDTAGGVGDFTGQMTYDTFNVPLTNALNGTIDPVTGFDACPISTTAPGVGIGVIVVCPQFENGADALGNPIPSPLTGQAVVKNLMQGKYSLIAHPGANREAAGEEWLQTNSLDGGHFLDSFLRVGEPAYFQEFGPGGYHVFMGMANPAHINARLASLCAGNGVPNAPPPGAPGAPPFNVPCRNNVNGQITNLHQSRSPNENLYPGNVFAQGDARNYATTFAYTNCYAAIGDSDGATMALAKCDEKGNFQFTNLPDGNYGIVVFDQWDDFIVDGSSRPVNLSGGQTVTMTFPTFTWQTHLWSRAYMDTGGLGAPVLLADGTLDPIRSPGLIQVPTRIRQRNGKFVNTLLTDIGGNTRFDETFPLFAFYTVESDNTRFRTTGVHAVNDAGGKLDGPAPVGNGNTGFYQGILNSTEPFPLPAALQYPGSHYCASADCPGGFTAPAGNSAGRVDPGSSNMGTNAYVSTIEGWQGGVSEFDMLDWGKTPYIPGENGGISGRVVYVSTRPFDDPRMNFQNLWDPLVPRVTINLYQEGTAPDGSTSLTLVDTTQTTSWDDWAQGFRANGTPNMSCTGQDPADPFFTYTMAGTRNFLTPGTPVPNNSQYRCYDGYHNLNQLQPAPYDGKYQFPSQACLTGTTFTVAGNPTAYNCATIPNPAFGQAGALGAGAAAKILPAGKYVTEVIVPPNWELNKEEDLNLLIGDQWIAPAVAQFGGAGLGNIFITPDQASIDAANPSYTGPYTPANPYNQPFNCTGATVVPGNASTCAFTPNTTNNGKQAGDYGRTSFGSFGPGGVIMQNAPCVGLLRVVPDYLSISPESGEVSPFAGVSKNLCDRREITLDDQMQADSDFFIWTKVPKAVTFTGFISDDFSSEFDPASPAFGEKFAIPNVPVSIKDFDGLEVSRIYSDQWGTFNGLVYGSWEVDVPNITGYSPNMMVTCMNDPGPISDPAHPGTIITDPFYTPNYSTFCYENPFMPGDATYLDTPVVPVSAFAEGYNPPDCNYPDGTPMIKSVRGDTPTGAAGAGPWVSAAGHTITITAGGDAAGNIVVPNNAYSGPAATTSPYNLKTVTRHVGFGAGAHVTIGGVAATCGTATDLTMTCSVPAGVPACPLLQTSTGGIGAPPTGNKYPAQCGQLVITTTPSAAQPIARQSIDAVTVTIGGKAPTYINGENATNNAIQTAIDNAHPGDLLIVGPGTYNELVLMWKPVRLQGVGDGSVTINANTHPAGKALEPWRRQVNCLFGLALNGGFISTTNPYDPNFNGTAGSGFVCLDTQRNAVDPIPGEPVVGWTANLNGNLAELLQEPTLMGAYEGAGITILAKGLENNSAANCAPEGAAGCIPLNAQTGTVADNGFNHGVGDCNLVSPFYQGNFLCNPSRIDGLSVTNSSQGGGGIFAHGYNHFLEVSNNHVFGNAGTLTGGITIGQMETVDPTLVGTVAQPLMLTHHTYVHNNSVTTNAAYGDELNSNTPSSAGGATMCTGSDYYRFAYNWVCGNLSTGDGGGMAHHGFIYNGTIEHNAFVFNQSINPTITTYGGGLVVLGAAPDGAAGEAGLLFDIDVAPGLSDGIGPGLTINANLFQGNTAEEGSGGGLMLMHVNGNDVANNPSNSDLWYKVNVTNNIFGNNVAGWTGGGVALFDAVAVDFRNNTVVSNDTTASAGVLFNSLGAPNANHAPPGCNPTANPDCTGFSVTTSFPEPAGLATEQHSSNFLAAFSNANVTCPPGNDTVPPTHACTRFSVPQITSDLFWQNRAFHIVPNAATGAVQLTPALSQTATGGCPAGAQYWDIGVYGDATSTTSTSSSHASGLTLHPTFSLLDDPGDYTGANNTGGSGATTVATQYCDGSRVPPEIAPALCSGPSGHANAPGCIQPGTVGVGTTVPGGVPDSLVPPLPLFTLTPAATVDEGSNWINMFYGPLSLTNPVIQSGAAGYGVLLGNYAPGAGSSAIDGVPTAIGHPSTDFFGNPRPDGGNTNRFDIGAIEIVVAGGGGGPAPATVGFSGPTPPLTTPDLTVKNGVITVTNTAPAGSANLVLTAAPTITKTSGSAGNTFSITGGTCTNGTIVASGGGNCTINVRYTPVDTTTAVAHVTLNDTGAATASQNSPNFNGN